ncbi:hypothetical protein NLI96_g2578 [Meripilus lineatus]|uniref:N-acetyltransferase domain-containing protein n=1 Tax=Meripilus lineatus TaxID=2056292 RepID=A0AAD5YJU8_9APHY|nr:hypothetical protein NLI96_g2578 [Physisporinus lineatus]
MVLEILRPTPPQDNTGSRLRKAAVRASTRLSWTIQVYQGRAWTIESGDAAVICVEPYKESQRPRKDKALEAIVRRFMRIQVLFDTKEQQKRRKEIGTKMEQLAEATLGEMQKEMVNLASIMTKPEKQGRGYGTALGKIVTDIADAEARDSWLFSSNVEANTGFYNNLGYITVATFLLGDDNPTWRERPVTIALVGTSAHVVV